MLWALARQRLGGARDRTVKKQVEELHKVELGVDHLIYSWSVEFAATSISVPDCVEAVERQSLTMVIL